MTIVEHLLVDFLTSPEFWSAFIAAVVVNALLLILTDSA